MNEQDSSNPNSLAENFVADYLNMEKFKSLWLAPGKMVLRLSTKLVTHVTVQCSISCEVYFIAGKIREAGEINHTIRCM